MIKQIYKYKELIAELILRDLRLQYRKPFLGVLWMLIIPFSTAIVYKILFSDFFHATSGKYPYFIYLMTALLPWNYFASSVQRSSRSILDSRNIINTISFPKYLLPVSAVLVNLVNFLPTLLVMTVFLICFRVNLSVFIFFLPFVIIIHTFLIVGIAFLVSSFQVIYRDTEYIVQVLLMVLFFLTPGIYTLEELISKANPLFVKFYMLNPLVGILNLYRIALIGNYTDALPRAANLFSTVINPVIWAVALLYIGYIVFKKYEKSFFDYLNL